MPSVSNKIIIIIAVIGVVFCAAPLWAEVNMELPSLDEYVGAEGCKVCHEDKYRGWSKTYHSTVVRDTKKHPEAILGDFTQQGIGFKKEDIEYTIGGHWNQRYMKQIGDEQYILPKLWSVASQRWEPYNVWGWRKMPYSKFCVGCHVTRYDPENKEFVEHTIGCESCHGPGKEHVAAGGGEVGIINPAKMGGVEMEMICASCHVRGKDNSDVYHFPVGYVPGRNLADYYTPGKMDEGESVTDALLRQFRTWWSKAGTADAQCEVCGIYGGAKKGREPKTVTDYCMGCHKYGDDYSKHTHHAATVKLECADCHKKVSVDYDEEEDEDVHSVSYFLVHKKTCYDRDFTAACRSCHESFTSDMIKARVDTWQGRDPIHD